MVVQDEKKLDFAWGLLTLAALKTSGMMWRANGGNVRRHRDLDGAGMCWKRLFFRDWNSVSIRKSKRGSKV
jgi:hypothetical protein